MKTLEELKTMAGLLDARLRKNHGGRWDWISNDQQVQSDEWYITPELALQNLVDYKTGAPVKVYIGLNFRNDNCI